MVQNGGSCYNEKNTKQTFAGQFHFQLLPGQTKNNNYRFGKNEGGQMDLKEIIARMDDHQGEWIACMDQWIASMEETKRYKNQAKTNMEDLVKMFIAKLPPCKAVEMQDQVPAEFPQAILRKYWFLRNPVNPEVILYSTLQWMLNPFLFHNRVLSLLNTILKIQEVYRGPSR